MCGVSVNLLMHAYVSKIIFNLRSPLIKQPLPRDCSIMPLQLPIVLRDFPGECGIYYQRNFTLPAVLALTLDTFETVYVLLLTLSNSNDLRFPHHHQIMYSHVYL